MSKIIKVSMDLEVTVHDFPEGRPETQNRQLCELIGGGCDTLENVMPKRLYREQLIQEAKAALSWEVFSLAFMELCKENAPVTPTKASEA